MKIIGAGFGRTGTLSLKKALEQLGFGPCYHMFEAWKKPRHIRLWLELSYGKKIDWKDPFQHFQSALDFPASLYYQELMDYYPDSKVILTVRDPGSWYESTFQTIYKFRNAFPNWMKILFPPGARYFDMIDRTLWGIPGIFKGRFEDREHSIKVFENHIKAVKDSVPSERLLVFSVKEGWKPLCEFLGIDKIPDKPFPHINDRSLIVNLIRLLKCFFLTLYVVLAALIILLISSRF